MTDKQTDDFSAFDKKVEQICKDIKDRKLPPRVAVLTHGLPLPLFDFLIKRGEISAAVSRLIEMRDGGALSEDEFAEQVKNYTDAVNLEEVIDHRLERYWRELMAACGEFVAVAMGQFTEGDPSAAAGKEMIAMASTMFNKNSGDPLFAPHLEVGSDTTVTAQSILQLLNNVAQEQHDDNIKFIQREQADRKDFSYYDEFAE